MRLVRSAAVVAAALLVGLGGAAPALAQTPGPPEPAPSERAATLAQAAVVQLTGTFSGYVADQTGTYFNGGMPYEITTTCTGFVVNPDGYIGTAGHCVDVMSPEGIRPSFIRAAAEERVATTPGLVLEDVLEEGRLNWTVEGEAKNSPVDGMIEVVAAAAGPDVLPARVVDVRPFGQGDVALLKVEADVDLPVLELTSEDEVPVGTPLLSVGFPASVGEVTASPPQPSVKEGQVSASTTADTMPVYEISAALSEGASGGPTVDLEGRVIGVNSFGPEGEPQAFNFVVSSMLLTELLNRNGVRNELGPDDQLFRQALDAHSAGRYSEAIAGLDRLLQVTPDHAQAEMLRAESVRARDQFGDAPVPVPAPDSAPVAGLPFGLSLLQYLVIGGGVLVLGALIVVLLVIRNRYRRVRAAGAGPVQGGPGVPAYSPNVPPGPAVPPSSPTLWLPVRREPAPLFGLPQDEPGMQAPDALAGSARKTLPTDPG